jgi:CRP-like cAMP-binding protein
MYFIVKGSVYVISDEGINLATLNVGKYFGEMALVAESNVRTASVQAGTDISVAIMSIANFNVICEVYPLFKERVKEVVQRRKEQNKITIQRVRSHTRRIEKEIARKIDAPDGATGELSESLSPEQQPDEEEKENAGARSSDASGTHELGSLSQRTVTSDILVTGRRPEHAGDHPRTSRNLLSKRGGQPADQTAARGDAEGANSLSDREPEHPLEDAEDALSDLNLHKRFSRVPLRASGIQGYFKIGYDNAEHSVRAALLPNNWTCRNFMKYTILGLIIYNLVFIPLQLAFRIEFSTPLVLVEVLTVVVYSLDIYFRLRNLR